MVVNQIEDADCDAGSDINSLPWTEEVEIRRKLEGLIRQHSTIPPEMVTARNPRYRNMLGLILNHIELARLMIER